VTTQSKQVVRYLNEMFVHWLENKTWAANQAAVEEKEEARIAYFKSVFDSLLSKRLWWGNSPNHQRPTQVRLAFEHPAMVFDDAQHFQEKYGLNAESIAVRGEWQREALQVLQEISEIQQKIEEIMARYTSLDDIWVIEYDSDDDYVRLNESKQKLLERLHQIITEQHEQEVATNPTGDFSTTPQDAIEAFFDQYFPRYLQTDQIGQGKTAQVFLVFDTVSGEIRVAKRFSHTDQNSELDVTELLAEARAMAAVHDHFPPLTDHFLDVDQIAYSNEGVMIIMELAPLAQTGDDFRAWLQWQRDQLVKLSYLRQYIEQTAKIASAMHGAFPQNDLKPSNFLIIRGAGPGEIIVKLIDLGFGSAVIGLDAGKAAGTPPYMSMSRVVPKRFENKPGDFSSFLELRKDVYALAVQYYELITGHHPLLGAEFLKKVSESGAGIAIRKEKVVTTLLAEEVTAAEYVNLINLLQNDRTGKYWMAIQAPLLEAIITLGVVDEGAQADILAAFADAFEVDIAFRENYFADFQDTMTMVQTPQMLGDRLLKHLVVS